MNKKTAIHRLEVIEQEAQELRKMIDEKPKLRHGDFGYSDEPCYPRIVLNNGKLASGDRVFDYHEADRPTVILGNIFDLMKDWGEDLTEFSVKGNGFKLTGKISSDIWLHIDTGSSCYSLSEAEEIWRKLGQMIATYKRTKT